MKKSALALALALCFCAGCATRYNITLINGDTISAHGKPKLNDEKTRYVYTDNHGQKQEVFAGRVREIQPVFMAKKNSDFTYNPNPK